MGKLKELMDFYGSDKGSIGHRYADLYEVLLHDFTYLDGFKMLEVGVGSLETEHMNNMSFLEKKGFTYKQGASTRAWGEYFAEGNVYGIDVAEDTLFEEGNVKTFIASSVDAIQIEQALGDLKFDLIVDDGVHRHDYQVKTLDTLWDRLNEGGLYIIEDINNLSGVLEGIKTLSLSRMLYFVVNVESLKRSEGPVPSDSQLVILRKI